MTGPMSRIAFCLPALPSHAAVHGVLARELMRRGHRCHFVGGTGLGPLAAHEGIEFTSLRFRDPDLRGAGLLRTLRATASTTRGFIDHGPTMLKRLAPDLVIADQAEPGASLAAEAVGLRRATLASALPMDRDESIPPPFLDWPWQEGEAARKRNRGGWRVADLLMTLQRRALARGCDTHGLPVRTGMGDWISPLLDLRQLPRALDFPHDWPASAVVTGPLRDRDDSAFPINRDGRPVVFASLGTLAGRQRALLHAICAAADSLGVTLLLAHAGMLTPDEAARLPGKPILRDLFPQRAVLAQADACITHGGMNTVLDCAAARVPMVAIPLAFEQPATAARLAHHGVARVIPRRRATARSIGEALSDILNTPSFRAALDDPAREIAATGGVARAADRVEDAMGLTRSQSAAS